MATVTPNAGRITTSSGPIALTLASSWPMNSIPMARSFSLTCGLWMISPVRNTRRSGKRSRVW